MKEISSKNNPIFKHLKKLISNAAYRYECKSVVITGDIIINEISSLTPIKTHLSEQEISLKAENKYKVPKDLLKSLLLLPSNQGSIAEVILPEFKNISGFKKIAIFDRITDPGNMGTMIRSALAFGIEGIHITKGSCDPFNDKVIRSSKGAVFKIPLSYESHTELKIENFDLLLADMKGTNIETITLNKPVAILLSNETKGLDPKWKGQKINIKISNDIESLNVGIAGSILFYELAKHQQIKDNSLKVELTYQ
ncbi:MAG: 23S rRNA (guanosine-2'-O-)-methyltransferase RlmB [Chlamydiia bacterium]|nr:23S rRNA (guanosine-2'-O-)-methyltransferase RlmB [Chlamydiia bacterium]